MKTKKINSEKMLNYYFDLLTYTKNPKHKKYIVEMIGFICGELPNPIQPRGMKKLTSNMNLT